MLFEGGLVVNTANSTTRKKFQSIINIPRREIMELYSVSDKRTAKQILKEQKQ